MTPKEIELVTATWAMVVPIKEKAAALFYGRLFEMDPAVKPMFKTDLTEQGRKLMSALSTVVNALSDVQSVIPALQGMARRHVGYGVRAEHYDTVGAALLWTLETGLGPAFTPEVKAAWTTAYTTVAGVMKEAAYPVAV